MKGTNSIPLTNGPKPFLESGSSDIETAAKERPWKLPVAPTIIHSFFGIFFTKYPHLLHNLKVNSHDSTPATLGTTLSICVNEVEANKKALIYLCRIDLGTVGNFSSCKWATTASTIVLFNCP